MSKKITMAMVKKGTQLDDEQREEIFSMMFEEGSKLLDKMEYGDVARVMLSASEEERDFINTIGTVMLCFVKAITTKKVYETVLEVYPKMFDKDE